MNRLFTYLIVGSMILGVVAGRGINVTMTPQGAAGVADNL